MLTNINPNMSEKHEKPEKPEKPERKRVMTPAIWSFRDKGPKPRY